MPNLLRSLSLFNRPIRKNRQFMHQSLDELSLLNITSETLFPGLDEAATAVTQRYYQE